MMVAQSVAAHKSSSVTQRYAKQAILSKKL